MSFLLANGLIEVVVPVGQKICLTSYGAGTTKVETGTGPNNYPTAFSLLKLITNSDYTSPVFTKDTIVKITAGLCDVEYIVGINPFPTISRVTSDNNGSFLLDDNTVIDGNLSVSGSLGIGTSTPAFKLDLSGTARITGTTRTPSIYGTTNGITEFMDSLGTTGVYVTGAGASPINSIRFFSAGAATATIDSAGNLGLGVTPSAWGTFKAFQVGLGYVAIGSTDFYQGVNNYFDGTNYRYITSSFASQAYQLNGAHVWRTAPSGTAGAAITFTPAMTLTQGGNLLVGTTSDVGFRFRTDAGASINGHLVSGTTTGIYTGWSDATATNSPQVGGIGDNLIFRTTATERARITSAGNHIATQPAESAQNTSVTLTVAQLQSQIIAANAVVTLTLPTGTSLETYTTGMAVNTAFEVVFIATTANAITIAANGNTTVGSLTINGNTSGTFRFRKTAANTFTVYRTA
jgi:hypothetical protein